MTVVGKAQAVSRSLSFPYQRQAVRLYFFRDSPVSGLSAFWGSGLISQRLEPPIA